MNAVPSNYWPKSLQGKALLILFLIAPFALIGTFIDKDNWYTAAIPLVSITAGWLGRVLMQLDDDQLPGAATSIRMSRREEETDQSRRSTESAGIAPRTGHRAKTRLFCTDRRH